MVENKLEQIDEKVRLPKNFSPNKYHLDVFVDIMNIKYKIYLEIDLTVKNPGHDLIILNSKNTFYDIKEILCKEYDPIGDFFFENPLNEASANKRSLNFCFSEELIEFFNYASEIFQNFLTFFCAEKKNEEEKLVAAAYEINVLSKFSEFVHSYYSLNNNEKETLNRIIQMHSAEFNLIKMLQSNSENDQLFEEAVYIKLPKKFNEGEKFKLCFEIDGRIRCHEDRYMGFYLSIFGPQSNDMKLGRQEFKKLWHKKMNSAENYLKNAIFAVACEPIEFRTIFPCFDEPSFKSKFNLKINIDKEILEINPRLKTKFRIISNGELLEISEAEKFGKKSVIEYKFSESPLMSIYLLTWTMGFYDYVETISSNILIRVYSLLDRQSEASFALDLAQKALEFYKNYFKIPYMFHKLDLVPIPNLEFRALECWGCIIFLNYALLVNKFLDVKEKKNVARTIVHELCHMWFGNLVTMDWWNDIWLNEGFARFLEFECLSEIKPDFHINDKFIELFYQDALLIDESQYTHPIRAKCPSPKDLPKIFDTISYVKGASCIRMIYFFIGKEKFKDAITFYLEKFRYKNTTTEDLEDVFLERINVDLKALMQQWVSISGHPALYVYLSSDKLSLVIDQFPFPNNLNTGIQDANVIWKIPLFVKTHEKEFVILMEQKTLVLRLKEDLNIEYDKLLAFEHFVKVNFDMTGFYRVFYNTKEQIDNYKNNFAAENLSENLMNVEETSSNNNKFLNNKKYFFDNILLNTLIHNHKKLSAFDIVGIICDYLIINDYSTILIIIDRIKPIEDYLILFYTNKIYSLIKNQLFKYLPFKEFLLNENKSELFRDDFDFKPSKKSEEINNFLNGNYEVLFNSIEKLHKNLFAKIINYDSIQSELFEKVYVKDPLCYLNESKDEFLELALYFSTSVVKSQELISYILKNYEKGKAIIHKNLKYEVYHIANLYSNMFLKDTKQEINVFDFLMREYTNEFYDLSIQGRNAFRNCFLDFEFSSNELLTHFFISLKNDDLMSEVYFKQVNYYKQFPFNRKKFIDCYIQLISNDFLERKSIFSGNLQFLSYLKNHPILKKDLAKVLEDVTDYMLAKIIVFYIYNSFKKFVSINERKSLFNIIVLNVKYNSTDNEITASFINLLSHLINYLES